MRAKFAITFAVLGGILVVALAVILGPRLRPATSDDQETVDVPLHFFVADDSTSRRGVNCGASASADRFGHLPEHQLFPCRFEHGWLPPSPWGTWSNAEQSRLIVALGEPAPRRLLLTCRAQTHTDPGRVQTMTVEVNGHRVADLEVPTNSKKFSIRIPEEVQRAGDNIVAFSFGYLAGEEPTAGGRRQRLLAVNFGRITLEPIGQSFGARLQRLRRAAKNLRSQVWSADDSRFVLAGPGRLVIPLTMPRRASDLDLELRLPPDLDRGRTTIDLTVDTVDGISSRRIRLPIEDTRFETSPNVLRGQIAVDEFAGATCLVELDVDPRPRSAVIEFRLPRAITSERSAPHTAPSDGSIDVTEAELKPDIVLITLDAARADHFGCYGYSRPTTPNIDRLARDSLVFPNAYALAPYTLNSVATMITGLSFLDHGVVVRGDTLSEDATTLAESLRSAGYRTACFSSTPNNSPSRNFHQGYDEFHEVWRLKSNRRDRVPHLLSQQVVEWLSTFDDSAPLHLQLHFVPPHGPYTPAPRFDVFSDPAYDGPCDGESTTLWAINDRRIQPTEADLRQIVALYDGNLRAADDAVDVVLKALQRRPRWRQTVVLITADHGEAFFEHGMMSHNSTLYREMLHVPFILRVPPPLQSGGIDTAGLVSLADIAPTLLGTAGLRPDGPIEGTDLLKSSGPKSRGGRYLVTRNGNKLPLMGFRSLRRSAILASTGHGELYDLTVDPGEAVDLYLDDPAGFAGLALLISRRITRPASVAASTERAHIDDSERSMLEALGYVE